MVATNDAFHWAGLVHLYRRVLGRRGADPEVQFAVGEIVRQLGRVRRGGTAEANLLFPMFTAGCDAPEEGEGEGVGVGGVRKEILERLRGVEGSGMTQVSLVFFSFRFWGGGVRFLFERARGTGEGVGGGSWGGLVEVEVSADVEGGCRFGKRGR